MEELNIKQLRENKKLTQLEFATILGVSRSVIAKIESDELDISKRMFEKLIKTFPDEIPNYKNIYKYAHLNTHQITHQNFNNENNYSIDGVDLNYYYNQNLEYEQMQPWLVKILQLLYYQCERKFNKREIEEIYSCMTNISPIIYVKEYGEDKIKDFINEHKFLIKSLIDKYLKEYFETQIKKNGYTPDFSFLN